MVAVEPLKHCIVERGAAWGDGGEWRLAAGLSCWAGRVGVLRLVPRALLHPVVRPLLSQYLGTSPPLSAQIKGAHRCEDLARAHSLKRSAISHAHVHRTLGSQLFGPARFPGYNSFRDL